jgi:hypothetical protein
MKSLPARILYKHTVTRNCKKRKGGFTDENAFFDMAVLCDLLATYGKYEVCLTD